MNIPKPGEEFDSLDEFSKSNFYQKVYLTLLEFKKEIEITFDAMEGLSKELEGKFELERKRFKAEIGVLNNRLQVYGKRQDYQALYTAGNRRIKDLESELAMQVGFLENQIKEKQKEIEDKNLKIAEMKRGDFMVTEQMASLRKELDIVNKKNSELDARLKKRQQQAEAAREGGPAAVERPKAGASRPSSRGKGQAMGKLPPIKENAASE